MNYININIYLYLFYKYKKNISSKFTTNFVLIHLLLCVNKAMKKLKWFYVDKTRQKIMNKISLVGFNLFYVKNNISNR